MTLAAPPDGAVPIINQSRSEVLGEALGPLLARARGDPLFAPPIKVIPKELVFKHPSIHVGDHAGRSVLWQRAIGARIAPKVWTLWIGVALGRLAFTPDVLSPEQAMHTTTTSEDLLRLFQPDTHAAVEDLLTLHRDARRLRDVSITPQRSSLGFRQEIELRISRSVVP